MPAREATVTEPLREEHRDLLPHIDRFHAVADSIGEAGSEDVRRGVDAVYEFLAHHLIPHAEAEERALYPVVARVMGAPEATATMSRDHVEVMRLTERLASLRAEIEGAIDPAHARALRRVLYGLYALVKVHFAKEEEVYLPLLDERLLPDEAARMFADMEAAAAEARQATGARGGAL